MFDFQRLQMIKLANGNETYLRFEENTENIVYLLPCIGQKSEFFEKNKNKIKANNFVVCK